MNTRNIKITSLALLIALTVIPVFTYGQVAIKADKLPAKYDPAIWQPNGMEVQEGIELKRLEISYESGERHEKYGYL